MFELLGTLKCHGNAFFAEYVGPSRLLNVNGIHWSDINGVRRGGGVTFAGASNTRNYFHLSFPVLEVPIFNPALSGEGVRQALTIHTPATHSLTLVFAARGAAAVTHAALFDGGQRYWFQDRNDAAVLSGASAPALAPNVPINVGRRSPAQGLGLSVGVAFGAGENHITFVAAIIRVIYTFFEPTDPRP